MILILWDSLRIDCIEPLKGIFPEETWSKYQTIEGFTAPVIASTFTGKTPEELNLPRDPSAFYHSIDPELVDDTLFDHFDSHISVGRLIGPGSEVCPLPPSRRGNFKILPPINWNAVSNWDIDIFNYVGQKWSKSNDSWWDLIYWHSFVTHGPWSIYDSMGAKESPEVINCDRLMRRMAETDPEGLMDWYMKGVKYAAATLRGLDAICGGKETIICFADHGEALGEEINGQRITGHFQGMHKHPLLGTVPVWINRDVEIPRDINNLTMKDWVVEMYNKYEKNNPEYQKWKEECYGTK